jgi:uncharacterized SAM-binding protein YcdF (DUF218 family)
VFFYLSKILDVFLTPLAWTVLLVLVGIAGPPRRRWVAALGVALLLFFSLESVSNALYRSLEEPPLRTYKSGVTYDVVILLGGVVDDRAVFTSGERSFNDNNERLLETYDLLRTGAAKNAIISGGVVSANRSQVVEAHALTDQLVAWGIAPKRIVIEDKAKNTHENAVESAAIVRAQGWKSVLIVTSANHMPRAYGCFRAEGLDVDTKPVDFRSYGSAFSGELIPRAEYLQASSAAIREWFGRWIYRLRGYSK